MVLTSSWKSGWEPYRGIPRHLNYWGKYLENHLKKKGNVRLLDKTREPDGESRGLGIKIWLSEHLKVTSWVVLDDEIFPDYQKQNIYPHLVLTNEHFGLTESDADAAIKILTG